MNLLFNLFRSPAAPGRYIRLELLNAPLCSSASHYVCGPVIWCRTTAGFITAETDACCRQIIFIMMLHYNQFEKVSACLSSFKHQSEASEDFELYYKGRKQMATQALSITQSSVHCQQRIQNSLAETAGTANLIPFVELVRKR